MKVTSSNPPSVRQIATPIAKNQSQRITIRPGGTTSRRSITPRNRENQRPADIRMSDVKGNWSPRQLQDASTDHGLKDSIKKTDPFLKWKKKIHTRGGLQKEIDLFERTSPTKDKLAELNENGQNVASEKALPCHEIPLWKALGTQETQPAAQSERDGKGLSEVANIVSPREVCQSARFMHVEQDGEQNGCSHHEDVRLLKARIEEQDMIINLLREKNCDLVMRMKKQKEEVTRTYLELLSEKVELTKERASLKDELGKISDKIIALEGIGKDGGVISEALIGKYNLLEGRIRELMVVDELVKTKNIELMDVIKEKFKYILTTENDIVLPGTNSISQIRAGGNVTQTHVSTFSFSLCHDIDQHQHPPSPAYLKNNDNASERFLQSPISVPGGVSEGINTLTPVENDMLD